MFWRSSNFVIGVGVIHLLVVDCLVMKEKKFIDKVPCVFREFSFPIRFPGNFKGHIMLISPWISMIPLGLDVSKN